jgi:uncharacterized SAM-binding protein YcdF (DUF218 family)
MPDLLVVLGKNIGVGSSPEDIRNDPDYLSDDSRISALAAGMVYKSLPSGIDVLFSTGHTAGTDIPAEAAAMRAFTLRHYPDIPDARLLTEEVSTDTRTNAIEVAKILKAEPNYDRIDLMSVGFHVMNARKLFDRFGVPINRTIASDEVVSERSEEDRIFVQKWFGSERIKKEVQKEKIRSVLLATIDRRGRLLHAVTQHSRG